MRMSKTIRMVETAQDHNGYVITYQGFYKDAIKLRESDISREQLRCRTLDNVMILQPPNRHEAKLPKVANDCQKKNVLFGASSGLHCIGTPCPCF